MAVGLCGQYSSIVCPQLVGGRGRSLVHACWARPSGVALALWWLCDELVLLRIFAGSDCVYDTLSLDLACARPLAGALSFRDAAHDGLNLCGWARLRWARSGCWSRYRAVLEGGGDVVPVVSVLVCFRDACLPALGLCFLLARFTKSCRSRCPLFAPQRLLQFGENTPDPPGSCRDVPVVTWDQGPGSSI